MRQKRLLVAIGVLMIAASAMLLALWPNLPVVFAAELLHGATGGIIGPTTGAISLGLVGRRAMSAGIGRNQRFDAAGNALTAAGLGVIAQLLSKRAIFFGVALLAIPTLMVLSRIRSREIAYGRARNAGGRDEPGGLQRLRDLLKSRGFWPLPVRQSCSGSPTRQCFRWSARILAAGKRASARFLWQPP